MPLGIGIITYKRPMMLRQCLDRVREFTRVPYYLVVAEDGGGDGTADLCRQLGHTTVTGENKGVCWNKNRALYLLQKIQADPILLLEDDCWPIDQDWAQQWVNASSLWHHVNFRHPDWPSHWYRGGIGTPEDPWRSWELTGQATVTQQEALKHVGYLDTRFIGYGFGHIEWTERFCKANYIKRDLTPCLTCGLRLQQSHTFRNHEQVRKNGQLFAQIQKQSFVRRDPWQNQEEQRILDSEISEALQRNSITCT